MALAPNITTAYIALAGTLGGGIGLKVVEKWLSRSKEEDDTATQIRSELRSEVQTLREELRKVEEDLDVWKAKYYTLMDQFIAMRAELETALHKIKEQDKPIDNPPGPPVN